MIKLNTGITYFGNFQWEATVEVTQEQLVILGNKGLLQDLQRSPASNAEAKLAGYEKRPTGFKRNSIEFSEANADTLAKYLSESLEIADGVKIQPTATVIEKPETSKEPSYAFEKEVIAKHIESKDLLDWARDTVKYMGDGLDAENVEFLKAIRVIVNAKRAEILKSI